MISSLPVNHHFKHPEHLKRDTKVVSHARSLHMSAPDIGS